MCGGLDRQQSREGPFLFEEVDGIYQLVLSGGPEHKTLRLRRYTPGGEPIALVELSDQRFASLAALLRRAASLEG